MPFYEYRCNACGGELEAMQKMSDAPLSECPECGKSTLVKLISASGFRLRGAGWYATDFKKGGNERPSGSGKSDAAPSCGAGACPACVSD